MCKIKENGLLSIGLAIFVTMTTIIIIAGGAAYYLGLFDNLKKENNGGVNPKVPEEVVNNREDVIKNNGVEIINEAKFEGLTKISVFKGKAYFLSETEGGRHTPFSTDKRLQFVLEGEEVEGVIKLLGKAEIIYPGDEVIFNVDLFTPANIAVGFKFDIKEGGRIIGNGSILELIENKKNEEDNSKVLDECKEFPDKLKICQEYECEYTDWLSRTKIKRHIMGIVDQKCRYIEKPDKYTGKICNYPEQDRLDAANFYKLDMGGKVTTSLKAQSGSNGDSASIKYFINNKEVEHPLENKYCQSYGTTQYEQDKKVLNKNTEFYNDIKNNVYESYFSEKDGEMKFRIIVNGIGEFVNKNDKIDLIMKLQMYKNWEKIGDEMIKKEILNYDEKIESTSLNKVVEKFKKNSVIEMFAENEDGDIQLMTFEVLDIIRE